MPREADFCQLLTRVVTGIGDSLASVTRRECLVRPHTGTKVLDIEGWLWLLDAEKVAFRASLSDGPGADLLLVLDVADVIALSGALNAVPDAVLHEHREVGDLAPHLGALPELGHVASAAARREFERSSLDPVALRFVEHAMVRPGFDQTGILGAGDRTILEFELEVEGYPTSRAALIASWQLAGMVQETPPSGAEDDDPIPTEPRRPVRGRLAGYLLTSHATAAVQECADQLGLWFDRRPRQEIPNPAAHRGEIVVIEIQVGDEKRFEWARRLREQQRDASVVLLVHEPSRPRVIQGVLTRANAVVGCPVEERELWARLAACVPVDPCPVRRSP